MPSYYPIMINILDKMCMVIGGGKVAERKIKSLIDCGARVVVISPSATEEIKQLQVKGVIDWIDREYQEGDLKKGTFLVYVATDNQDINRACRKEAQSKNILINVVDIPELCDFIVPSVLRRGSLTLSVCTDGKSPMLSRKLREDLEKSYGVEYQYFIDLLGEIRQKAAVEIEDIDTRKELFQELVYNNNFDSIAMEDWEEFENRLWNIYQSYKNEKKDSEYNAKDKNRV